MFATLTAPLTAAARFHLVVGDGQVSADGDLTFNGALMGLVTGGEACDQGNTTGGDGCSSTCDRRRAVRRRRHQRR